MASERATPTPPRPTITPENVMALGLEGPEHQSVLALAEAAFVRWREALERAPADEDAFLAGYASAARFFDDRNRTVRALALAAADVAAHPWSRKRRWVLWRALDRLTRRWGG